MIATALSVYGKVGEGQAKAMAARIVEKDNVPEEANDLAKDLAKGAKDAIVQDFDKATER
jgi:hypothetical protein